MRIACFYIPDFSLAAHVRAAPELRHEPLVVYDGKGPAARVLCATPRVWQARVRPGFTLTQARALLPALVSRPRNAAAEEAAQQALLEIAEASSPRVEEGGPGRAFLDLCREPNESRFAATAVARAARLGLDLRIGIAGSKSASRIAAEEANDGPVVLPPGEEGAFLGRLPLERLRPVPALAALLERWGIRTIGALAGLPEKDIMVRLGKEGWELHREARGIDARPLVPRPAAVPFTEGVDLEWPVLQLDAFLFVARGLVERLLLRLESLSLAVRKIEMVLALDPAGHDVRAMELAAPTREAPVLLELLSREMESSPPESPILGVRLTVHPERPRRAQLTLFGPPVLSPDVLSATLSRLDALVGPGRFGSPRPADAHRPELYALEPFDPPPAEDRSLLMDDPSASSGAACAAVRVLRPPIELRVEARAETPVALRSLRNDGTQMEVVGTVRVASGPWRLEDGWWSGEAVFRDYWDVELSDGAIYRIYRDSRNAWFADGVYD